MGDFKRGVFEYIGCGRWCGFAFALILALIWICKYLLVCALDDLKY